MHMKVNHCGDFYVIHKVFLFTGIFSLIYSTNIYYLLIMCQALFLILGTHINEAGDVPALLDGQLSSSTFGKQPADVFNKNHNPRKIPGIQKN